MLKLDGGVIPYCLLNVQDRAIIRMAEHIFNFEDRKFIKVVEGYKVEPLLYIHTFAV